MRKIKGIAQDTKRLRSLNERGYVSSNTYQGKSNNFINFILFLFLFVVIVGGICTYFLVSNSVEFAPVLNQLEKQKEVLYWSN